MSNLHITAVPKMVPELDPDFRPSSVWNRAFAKAVKESGQAQPGAIAVERDQEQISLYKMDLFPEDVKDAWDEANYFYVERLVKCLLWVKGGWKVTIGGAPLVGDALKRDYAKGGSREFDADFMARVYEQDFVVEAVALSEMPRAYEKTEAVGGHLDGCRIGFDAGGSDRKVTAVMDGEVLFSDETVWHPKVTADPDYHFAGIMDSVRRAAAYLPRVDAIGVSSAGIYVNNRTMVASLFLQVPQDLFDASVKDIYPRVAKELGDVPIEVRNDGDVAALAGAASLNDTNILGIAMGTSEAVGYVDAEGSITGWLNELAFMPVDYNPDAMVDEWSGDYGCGVKYFSQDGVIKLAPAAGIDFAETLTPAEKLTVVQGLLEEGHEGARKLFQTIGVYFGYAVAHYSDFYDIKHLLILGRVTSGIGGTLILEKARAVLNADFPELANIAFHLPDESDRRVGQAITAAGLTALKG
ncbi:MAG: ROK family protein [Limnochordia bacterium]|nr:ROK family protein [Limnochordia bacterium]